MKEYPSIQSSIGSNHQEFVAYVFDKADGSNLRFEWSRKRGWYKYGTRTRLLDLSDDVFGCAIKVFENTLASGLERIASANRWDSMVAFAEFQGEGSFAGVHIPEAQKELLLFDIAVAKKGFLDPKEFLKMTEGLPQPKFLGIHNWTRGLVDQVRRNEFEGVTFEGVVGKGGTGHKRILRKAKTQIWVEAVRARYGDEADALI